MQRSVRRRLNDLLESCSPVRRKTVRWSAVRLVTAYPFPTNAGDHSRLRWLPAVDRVLSRCVAERLYEQLIQSEVMR